MPKKSGKKAPEANAPETAEKKSEKQVNLLVKTDSMIERPKKDKEGNVVKDAEGKDKTFQSIRIPLQIDGKTEFGSIAVDSGRVRPATKPVKDENGDIKKDAEGKTITEPIEGYSNVWLRGESSKIKVNLPSERDADGKVTAYTNVEFTAGEIAKMNSDAKKAYKAEINGKEEQREVPEAPAVEAENDGAQLE